jgi:hypothetical protein
MLSRNSDEQRSRSARNSGQHADESLGVGASGRRLCDAFAHLGRLAGSSTLSVRATRRGKSGDRPGQGLQVALRLLGDRRARLEPVAIVAGEIFEVQVRGVWWRARMSANGTAEGARVVGGHVNRVPVELREGMRAGFFDGRQSSRSPWQIEDYAVRHNSTALHEADGRIG